MSGGTIRVAVAGEGRQRFTPPWRQALGAAGLALGSGRPDVVFVVEGGPPATGTGPAALVLVDPPGGAAEADAVIRTGWGPAEDGATRIAPFVDGEAVLAAARDRRLHHAATGARLFSPDAAPWLLAVGPGAEEGAAPWQALARAMSRLVVLDWRLIALTDPGEETVAAGALAVLPRERLRVLPDAGGAATLGLVVTVDLILAPGHGRVPLSLLQAQVAGVPAVASRGTAAAGALADGITGMLAASGNPESFANLVGFLLRHENFRRTFAANAFRQSFDDHDLAAPAHALGHVLRQALALARRRGGPDRAAGMLGDQG